MVAFIASLLLQKVICNFYFLFFYFLQAEGKALDPTAALNGYRTLFRAIVKYESRKVWSSAWKVWSSAWRVWPEPTTVSLILFTRTR